MSCYLLTSAARRDISNVWQYSADTWDEDQADRYVRELFAAIELLATDSGRAVRIFADDDRFVFIRSGRHLIFARPDTSPLEVIAVLHDRMDLVSHLTRRS